METLEELERNAKHRASALEPVVNELVKLNAQISVHNSMMVVQVESIITMLIQLRERINEQRS